MKYRPVLEPKENFFDGVVIKSDRFNVGTVRCCIDRLTYRRFKGTITIK